jgi:hypothetical protein
MQTALPRQASRIRHTFIRLVSPSDQYCCPTLHIQDVRTGSQPSFPHHFLTQHNTTRYSPYTAPALPPMPTDSQHTPCRTCGDRTLSINTSLSQQDQLVTCRTSHWHSAQATGQNTAQRFPSTANNGVPGKPLLLLFSIFLSLSPTASTVQVLSKSSKY